MREIKFRVYDESLKTMFYIGSDTDYTLVFGNEKPLLQMYSNGGEFVDEWPVDNVMQYAGKKDKNGVEIYEGDIVIFYYRDGWRSTEQIIWTGETFTHEWSSQGMITLESIGYSFEVIGNIYESPELLEKNHD